MKIEQVQDYRGKEQYNTMNINVEQMSEALEVQGVQHLQKVWKICTAGGAGGACDEGCA